MSDLLEIRKRVISMIYNSKASHIGSCLSIVDVLYFLYFEQLEIEGEDADKVILSKGHASVALYATLIQKGILTKDYESKYCINGGLLPAHLDMLCKGIDVSAGSLGHGLSIGAGMAFAKKNNQSKSKIYVILGDGECNEGSIWEAAMFAGMHKLDNLIVIVDFNNLQACGKTNEILNLSNIEQMWKCFGWNAITIDGHDVSKMKQEFNKLQKNKPNVIIANTIKGKGVSFMEDKLEWHYKCPNEKEFVLAIKELEDSYA